MGKMIKYYKKYADSGIRSGNLKTIIKIMGFTTLKNELRGCYFSGR
jgi:hypothetical protein